MLELLKRATAAGALLFIAAVGGNAASDTYKGILPALKNFDGLTYGVTVLVFLVVTVLIHAYCDPASVGLPKRRLLLLCALVLLFGYTAFLYIYGLSTTATQPAAKPTALVSVTGMATPKAPAVQVVRNLVVPAAIFDIARLRGQRGVIALAAEGNPDAVEMVADVLGMPLERRMVTAAFFKQKYVARALAGEPDLFAGVQVPPQLQRLLVLKVERAAPLKTNTPADAIRITESLSIAIVDAQQGTLVFKKNLTIDGDGYTDEFALDALRDNLQKSLMPVKAILADGH